MRARQPSRQARLLLAALAEGAEPWRFGYDLAGETGLASGTLYPLLARLAERGYLESRWQATVSGRPPRHLYRLSAAGRRLVSELELRDAQTQLPTATGRA